MKLKQFPVCLLGLAVLLGFCALLVQSAPMGGEMDDGGMGTGGEETVVDETPIIAENGLLDETEQCEVGKELTTRQCIGAENINNIVENENEGTLIPCRCPSDSTCNVRKIGEIYICETVAQQQSMQDDLLKYNMLMKLGDGDEQDATVD